MTTSSIRGHEGDVEPQSIYAELNMNHAIPRNNLCTRKVPPNITLLEGTKLKGMQPCVMHACCSHVPFIQLIVLDDECASPTSKAAMGPVAEKDTAPELDPR